MRSFNTVLIDADGTFLDFEKTESRAMALLLSRLEWEERDFLVRSYGEINRSVWKSHEEGRIEAEEINSRRFSLLFDRLTERGAPRLSAEEMGRVYLEELSRGDYLLEGALPFLEYLKGRCTTVLATNGLSPVQRARIAKAGLAPLFDRIAISGELGFSKPDVRFFEKALEGLEYVKEETLMIGDSLTSDMAGAAAFGIAGCWFNPGRMANRTDLSPDYEISDLEEIRRIL